MAYTCPFCGTVLTNALAGPLSMCPTCEFRKKQEEYQKEHLTALKRQQQAADDQESARYRAGKVAQRTADEQARQERRKRLGLNRWEAETPLGRFIQGFVMAILVFGCSIGWLLPDYKEGFLGKLIASLAIGFACGVGTSWAKRVYRFHIPSFIGVFVVFLLVSIFLPKKDQANDQAANAATKAPQAKQFSITCVTADWHSDTMTVNKQQFDTEWKRAKITVNRGDEQRLLNVVVTSSPDVCLRRNNWDQGAVSMIVQPEEQTKELVFEVGALPSPDTNRPLRGEGYVEVKLQERSETARLKVILQGWGQ